MRAALILPFAAAACSPTAGVPDALNAQARAEAKAAKEHAADVAAVRAGFAPAQPAPMDIASVDPARAPAPGVLLPPATMQYRYIGHWAPSIAQCAQGGWRFATRKLSTDGGTECDFPTVAAVPHGYELQGVCETGGRKTSQTLKLAFDESARRMRAEGRTLGPVVLLYCGD